MLYKNTGLAMKITQQLAFFIVLFFNTSFMVNANPLPASEVFTAKDINEMLSTQFPIEKSYEGVVATFSDPKVDIITLDKKVEISVMINATYKQQSLTAKGIFVGRLTYYDFEKSILFKRPILDHFYLQEDHMTDSLPAQRAIKQSMSHDFRDLQLIDLKPYELKAGISSPSKIEMSIDKIIVRWN